MLADSFDGYMSRHKKFSFRLERLLVRFFKVALWDDILMCLAVTLTGGFYYFERSMPLMDIMRTVVGVIIVLVWVVLSLTNGFRRRYGFLLFTLLYWAVPQFFIIRLEAMTDFSGYTMALGTAAMAAKTLVKYPLTVIAMPLGISELYCAVGLIVICEVLFILGFAVRNYCRNSEWYCEFRSVNGWIK